MLVLPISFALVEDALDLLLLYLRDKRPLGAVPAALGLSEDVVLHQFLVFPLRSDRVEGSPFFDSALLSVVGESSVRVLHFPTLLELLVHEEGFFGVFGIGVRGAVCVCQLEDRVEIFD